MTQSPVFVTGMPRSGTSLVYRTLQMHSSFKIGRSDAAVDLTETHIFTRSLLARHITENGDSRLKSYMLGDEACWEELCELIEPISRYQKVLSQLSAVDEHSPWRWTLDRHVTRVYFQKARTARSVRRIVEKTPGHTNWYTRIDKTFPHSKIVFVSRHPIDVYASYRKRLSRDRQAGVDEMSLAWLAVDPTAFCSEYVKSVKTAQRHKVRHSEQIELFRYEDLTHDVASTASLICGFLNVPYEPGMATEAPTAFSRFRPVGTPEEPLLRSRIERLDSVWTEYVSEDEAIMIENLLQVEMSALGYRRHTGRQVDAR